MPRRYPTHLKILVVENNPLLLRALRDMLEHWGVGQVAPAANGQEAMELLRREPYDLMVTDWVMEPVGGGQLVRWVRGSVSCLSPDLPIIVLTANADVATVRAAWDAGADTVLAKPASAATIARRIETVLNNPRKGGRSQTEAATAKPTNNNTPPPSHPAPPRPAISSAPPPLRLPPPPPRLSGPSGSGSGPLRSTDPKMVRLVLALDRLERALACPDALGTRLRHAVSDLQLAAAGNAAATAIAASLSTCVTWVDHDGESFQEAVQAHMDALRWTISIGGGADSSAALRVMVGALRAMVRSLSLRDGNGPSLWPDGAFGAPDHGGEAGHSPGHSPLPPA
ncbi:response regulator [Azospirillum sp. TSH58]|uniref:response regulator n=1 Tax=Azospirillum sp. TSH58 TaxID=664962 RepID=UPI000D6005C7|nr:response regulator [Azospirillum sp. TSH58]AWJ83243.1 response regulator [Azospirillum sp. TSH58]PWC80223.1 regulator [Azospirillum sp. TSH58]